MSDAFSIALDREIMRNLRERERKPVWASVLQYWYDKLKFCQCYDEQDIHMVKLKEIIDTLTKEVQA